MARLGAGIRKRANGSLEKRFMVNGKRYSVYGGSTKEVNAKELQLRQDIESKTYIQNRNITLDSYFNEWRTRKKNEVKENTIKTYSIYYRKHISPYLGSKRIKQIERREISSWQLAISKSLSISSCNTALRTLKVILNDAVNDEILIKNPADAIKSIKVTGDKATDSYHRALTEEEQTLIMNELKSDYYYEYLALMLCTGMRSGEVAALTWGDIDFSQNIIHVTKTLTVNENNSNIIGNSPKSEAGIRDIPINDSIKLILQSQRNKMGNIYPYETATIFVSVYGSLVSNMVLNKAISKALNRLKSKGIYIEHFTAHALRDTFATRFIEQGGQPQTLKAILGHSSLAITMDLYSHVLPNTKKKEMDSIHIAI